MDMKKFLCSALSALMMVPAVAPVAAQANEINSSGTGSSTVVLNVDAPTFSVTVPTGLPIYVDSEGVVTTADDVYITNSGHGSVTVTGVAITAKNNWSTVDVAKDLSNVPVNTQEFSMTINNETTTGANAITFDQENWPAIAATNHGNTDRFHLVYDADVAPQTDALNNDIADVVFTIGWNTADDTSSSSNGGSTAIVPKVLTDYYTFTNDSATGGWQVGLNEKFKSALNQAEPVAYKEWNPGDPLPVLPSTYQGKPVTNYFRVFGSCNAITYLDLSGWDTSNVSNMSMMFWHCESLSCLDLSSFDTSNVTDMASMFMSCETLKSLDLSNFDIHNVTDMISMFYDCNSLLTIKLDGFDTRNVTKMTSMFCSCRSLESLNLSTFDTRNVTDMSNMFSGCPKLTTCYGRTTEDCQRFNASKNKPVDANFIVKSAS